MKRIAKSVHLDEVDYAKELLMSGLRMKDGFNSTYFDRFKGVSVKEYVVGEVFDRYIRDGFLEYKVADGIEYLNATGKGYPVIDRILSDVLL